jgi:hypothetical protein
VYREDQVVTTDEKIEKIARAMLALTDFLRRGTDDAPVTRTDHEQMELMAITHTLDEVIAGHLLGAE